MNIRNRLICGLCIVLFCIYAISAVADDISDIADAVEMFEDIEEAISEEMTDSEDIPEAPIEQGIKGTENLTDENENELCSDLKEEKGAPTRGKSLRIVPRRKEPLFRGHVVDGTYGMEIPLVLQSDYKQTVCYIGGSGRSVATSGCGAACLSMVIAYLTGNTEQTPYGLFYKAVECGKYRGNGLDHDVLSSLAEEYGVEGRWIPNSFNEIVNALESGKPVIAHMGPGTFTQYGHYIVLRGITEEGLVLVNDPGSRSRSRYAYPFDLVLEQVRGESSFMVCEGTDTYTELSAAEAEEYAADGEEIDTVMYTRLKRTNTYEAPGPENRICEQITGIGVPLESVRSVIGNDDKKWIEIIIPSSGDRGYVRNNYLR